MRSMELKVRIYDKEKTIADCFKHRTELGIDIATRSPKRRTLREPSPKTNRLMEYAKINRVEKTIRPYVETLI